VTKPIHLQPHAPVAERVLLPGDPGRALRLAQVLTEDPRMLNHDRGLWGYTGTAADGRPLTIQSTGMGGPSAAIVVEELIALGARSLIRVGTCGALVDGFELGELLVADEVLGEDGTSRSLGAPASQVPDPDLLEGLAGVAGRRTGAVVTTDLFYDADQARPARWAESGAVAVEMEAAAVLAVAARHGLAAACILIVSDLLASGTRERISVDALEAAEVELGRAAAAAFGIAAGPS
jgi:DeoD family purine-nucleoside phosphorylase